MNIYFIIGICFFLIHILLGSFEGGSRKGMGARFLFSLSGIVLWPVYLGFYILIFILACLPWGKKKGKYHVDQYENWHDGLRDCIDDLNKKVRK
jgi:hypothetical protein